MQLKNKTLSLLNLLVLAAIIGWNYYSNSGIVDGKTVGSLSDKYDSLFTPAGYAFAIWGLIYLGLIVQSIYFAYLAFSASEGSEVIVQAVPGLVAANVANGLWLWFWLNEQLLISVVCMLAILSSLTLTVVRLNMERWNAPVKLMAFVWWPIDIYFGWIAVATIANVSSTLNALGFEGGLTETTWTVIAIGLATALALFMIAARSMREFAAVVIWALFAIAVRHWGQMPVVQWSAVAGATLLAAYSGYHAYLNRKTLPFIS